MPNERMELKGRGHRTLKFLGPFRWLAEGSPLSILDARAARGAGLYIWTARTRRGEVVLYVGETGRSFATRMTDHLANQLSGKYDIHDPKALRAGNSKLLWRGMYGPDREKSLVDYLARLPRLARPLQEYLRCVRFYITPFHANPRLRQRIEAALAAHLLSQGGVVREFLDDVRYIPRRSRERPIAVRFTWPRALLGVPRHLRV